MARCEGGRIRQRRRATTRRRTCLVDWAGWWRFGRHIRAGFTGTLPGLPGVTYLQVSRATALGNDAVWVQLDGELLGQLPMTFACVPAALSLVVP